MIFEVVFFFQMPMKMVEMVDIMVRFVCVCVVEVCFELSTAK